MRTVLAFLLLVSSVAAQTLPTTDMILHLDAADLSAAGDGGAISGTWPDQSAAGNNATAVSGPLFDADGIGGLPAVNFASGGYFSLPTDFKPTTLDVYIVAYLSSAAANTSPFCTDRWGSPSFTGYNFYVLSTRNTYTQAGDGTGATSSDRAGRVGSTQTADLVPLTTDCILQGRWRSTPYSTTSAINGKDVVWISPGSTLGATGGSVAYNPLAAGRVGGNQEGGSFAGRIAEVVAYSTIQNGRDRRRILKYLARKYGVTVATPRGDGLSLVKVPQSGAWTERETLTAEGHPRYGLYPGDPDRVIGSGGPKFCMTRTYDGSEYRIVAHYDAVRNLVIHRSIDGGAWTTFNFDGIDKTQVIHRGDGHSYVSLELTSAGILHVFYDHHNNTIRYTRSNAAVDTWTGATTGSTSLLLGTNESQASYVVPMRGRTGSMGYLWFRDGGNGNGDQFLYQWNGTDWDAGPATGTAGKLIDGKGSSPTENAYMFGPMQFDSQGRGWAVWMWDEGGGVTERHDICAMRLEADDSAWQELDGSAVTVPVVQGAASEPIAETIAQDSGLSDGSFAIDGEDVVHVAYLREDGSGNLQVFHLHSTGGTWATEQVSSYGAGYAWRDNTSGPVCLAKGKTVHILIRESAASTPTARHELCRYTKVGDGSWTRTVVAEGPDWQHCGPVVDFDAWWDKGEIILLAPSDEETKYTAEDNANSAAASIGVTPGSNGRETINKVRQAILAK